MTVPGLLILILLGLGGAATGAPSAAKASAETLDLYRAHCQSCHMADGDSPLEPLNFVDGLWKHGPKPEQVALVIAEGVPGSAMLAFRDKLTKEQVRALAAHVRSFDKSLKPAKKK